VIVLDSSFLIAFHNQRDTHHPAAARVMNRLEAGEWGTPLLPEYVFLEVTTVLAARRDVATAARVGATLLAARELEFVPCSDIFVDAFEVFSRQRETSLSFVDAAIVAICHCRGVAHVATFDAELGRTEGLTAVPEPA
jgi:predicted nucleic acid-binding protein